MKILAAIAAWWARPTAGELHAQLLLEAELRRLSRELRLDRQARDKAHVERRVRQLVAGAYVECDRRWVIIPLDGDRDNLLWRLPPLYKVNRHLSPSWVEKQLERWVRAGEPYPWEPQSP